MKNSILNILILFISVIGIVGAGEIVWAEITINNICPKLFWIPVCYIILVCLILSLVTHVLKVAYKSYFLFTGIGFLIAVAASINQFTGNSICPKTINGIAICYHSLVVFSSLLIIKRELIKYPSSSLHDYFKKS